MFDIVMIGHLTKDIFKVKKCEHTMPGGAVYYSSISATSSGAKVMVITRIALEDTESLSEMIKKGVSVSNLGSKKTVTMNLDYSDDMETREITVSDLADPFLLEDVKGINGTIFHLAGLIRGDFPDIMISHLASSGHVALDVQSVLRCEKDTILSFRDWPEKEKYMPYITYLKTDAAEAEILTGTTDRFEAAKILYGWGAKEVLITHMSELIVYDGNFHRFPFTMKSMVGRSGRGDTCFAAYLSWRLKHNVNESAEYAAALTSLKMEKSGAYQGTFQDVQRSINPGS
ncbi:MULTISPECIES: PfkB family carbohydrate kinase [unclassified Oceanispirochaeta]|uniref:PfkB family carbohydrate kinase n=1 Tax=unclassified Oceanispirochaeta TaxID=2635722 RepID=UPI000E090FE6|nr:MULTISPECIES: PfkB family carbohydrate kinase [unclassified Oceanispirochaeta]MBF9018647.1 carbohydrate kinase [Oceanispirochaeta sp. M2]NPD75084.1 carbohydrate kinase [Oceanispirochaeta sp. M1]RDG29071.1 carbohydrate kinase [Oceanispirochaeta sp. M1]